MPDAARSVQEALDRLEKVAAFLGKAPLHTARQIEHAIEQTQEAARVQDAFVKHLQQLIEAVSTARNRQAAAADTINDSVRRIDERSRRFEALQARFAAIGEAAKALNGLMRVIQEHKRRAGETTMPQELSGQLGEIGLKMDEVVAEAKKVADEARVEELHDFARDADSLRQQITSARHRIALVQTALAAEPDLSKHLS